MDKLSTKYKLYPARHLNETYKEYKERRNEVNWYIRKRLQKGRLLWPSSVMKTYLKGV